MSQSRSRIVVVATTFPFEDGKSPDGGATAALDHAMELARQRPNSDVVVLATSAGAEEGVTYLLVGNRRVTVVRTPHIDPPADNYNLMASKRSGTNDGIQKLLLTYVAGSDSVVCHEAHVDPRLSQALARVIAKEKIPSVVVVHTPDRVETGSLGTVESLRALRQAADFSLENEVRKTLSLLAEKALEFGRPSFHEQSVKVEPVL